MSPRGRIGHERERVQASLPHGAFLERKLRWKMHACREAEWIGIQHGVEGVKGRVEGGPVIGQRNGLHGRPALQAGRRLRHGRQRRLMEGLRKRSRTGRVIARILVVEHVRLRIVLLFYNTKSI